MFSLNVEKISKRFGRRKVFSDISFELQTGDSIAIVGPNGSGKTTLLATLLGSLRPSKGKISFGSNGDSLDEDQIRGETSLVSPYLNLYDNLTAEENLKFFATVAGGSITGKDVERMLLEVGLEGRGLDLVRGYSSGMKQRLKYAVALQSEPAFLFLDEPTSNLDEAGKKIVFDLVEANRSKSIILIATNEQEEYGLASKTCRVDQ